MTIHVPKWVLGALGVLLAVIIAMGAYLVGKRSGDGGGDVNGAEAGAVAPPTCSKEVAREVVRRRNPAVGLDDYSQPWDDTFESYSLGPVDCADLTGDGVDEMVIRFYFQTLSGASPWFIYGAENGHWDLKMRRMLSGRDSIRVVGDVVKESSNAYAPGESLATPSSKRTGQVKWDGQEFIYESREGIGDGEVQFTGDMPESIGGMRVFGSYLPDAIGMFGPPNMYGGTSDEVCNANWNDIGLIISFVSLGGTTACESGAIQSFLINGEAAQQAGWRVGPAGLTVGEREDELRSEYPNMAPGPAYYGSEDRLGVPGRDWFLITIKSPYGYGGKVATLSARMSRGIAVAYPVYVGAAGE